MVKSWFGVKNTRYSKAKISTKCVDENGISSINGLEIKVCSLVVFQFFSVGTSRWHQNYSRIPILSVSLTRIPIVKVKDADGGTKALYKGKLSLPADVIQFSWLYLFKVELMAQNTSKFISKFFLCLVFNEIKLKLVSNCFFCLN